MKKHLPLIAVFTIASAVMLCGVMVFFKPISEINSTIFAVAHPIGLVIYMGLSSAIFQWAFVELRSSAKAAIVVVAPQIVLIIDLSVRGERSWLTTLAGAVLLCVTWGVASFVHKKLHAR